MARAIRPGGPWEPNPSLFLGYNQSYEKSKYVVLPVPSDSGSTCLPGARFGPQELISASRFLEPYDPELDFSPADAGIHTLQPLEPVQGDPRSTAERVGRQVAAIYSSNRIPVIVGGDHSITPGAVSALSSELGGDLNLVVLDAHLDLYDEYGGSRFSHACAIRRAAEASRKTVIIGVRSAGIEEITFLRNSSGIQAIWSREIRDGGVDVISEAMRRLPPHPTYLSLDLDVMDPGAMPCVGCPEPGGLDWWETTGVLEAVFRLVDVIAFDLTEFTPCPGSGLSSAYTAAKLLYKMIALSELS